MVQKQDRINPRNPSDLERKYNFKRSFGEVNESIASAQGAADRAAEAAREADQNASERDRKLDQREVFRRLTNGGKAQAVYLNENGEIFINATYIAVGVLSSLNGSTFYLDLVNGILKGDFDELLISGKTAEEIAKDVVDEQTQDDLIDKLTGGGEDTGIYLEDGRLYINANKIVAGVLQSLDGGTFYLDLANNVLKGKFSELSIDGRAVSWKDNGDGTFTLVGK